MKISKIDLENIRCVKKATLNLSPTINIFVGPNNSGKSTLINSVACIQHGFTQMEISQLRSGESKGKIKLSFSGNVNGYFGKNGDQHVILSCESSGSISHNLMVSGVEHRFDFIPDVEPDAFIYPFLSKRKSAILVDTANIQTVMKIDSSMSNLNAKIDRISDPGYQPAHDYYIDACKDLFGFVVGSAHSERGKIACYTIENNERVPLQQMGEGILSMLSLIVNLAIAKNKLFIIEEPENDLHPNALKSLLKLIIESSSDNQFLVSTHSNIALRYLGAAPESKVFDVSIRYPERLPTTRVVEISTDPSARREVLAKLGYELIMQHCVCKFESLISGSCCPAM